jgi:hypothetical protein
MNNYLHAFDRYALRFLTLQYLSVLAVAMRKKVQSASRS